jgi:hypothetical protein
VGGSTSSTEVAGAGASAGASGRLSRAGRRWRTLATLVVGAVLLAGTAVGTDDWFPLGPFRMFTNRAAPTGDVRGVTIEAVDATGRSRTIGGGDVGLRHAELEGQLWRFEASPDLLASIAAAYASVHPDAPPLVVVELRERRRRIEQRVLADEVEERTVARWER